MTAVANNKEVSMIPELRFKEFEGEWSRKRLDEIAKIQRGRFSPRPRNNPEYYGGDIPFVQTSDVVHSKGRITTYSQTLNEKGLKVSKKFSKGTLLITIAANIGYAGVLEYDMACPDSLIGISCGPELYNWFLNCQLEIEQPKMDYLAVAAAQKNINIEFLNPYKFSLPTLPEQQKIASFLSAVDEKIQQLTRKKTLLEQYKKGVMQKLFAQKIRFKDENGNDYPDWEEKMLKQITSYVDYRGRGPEKSEEGIFLVTAKNIKKGYIDYECSKEYVPLNNRSIVMSKGLPKKGDILFTTEAPLGNVAQIDNDDIALAQRVIKFRGSELISNNYLLYYMLSPNYQKLITRWAIGTTVLGISGKDLHKTTVQFPSLPEQQKIATYLSSLDQKIETVNHQITHTQTFKKGLLQGMFV